MAPKKPETDGEHLGQTETRDGVVWTWTGTDWIRGELPGVTHRLETIYIPDETDRP